MREKFKEKLDAIREQIGDKATIPVIAQAIGIDASGLRQALSRAGIKFIPKRPNSVQAVLNGIRQRLFIDGQVDESGVYTDPESGRSYMPLLSFYADQDEETQESISSSSFLNYCQPRLEETVKVIDRMNRVQTAYNLEQLQSMLDYLLKIISKRQAVLEKNAGFYLDDELGVCGTRTFIARKLRIKYKSLDRRIRKVHGSWEDLPSTYGLDENGNLAQLYQVKVIADAVKDICKADHKIHNGICYVKEDDGQMRIFATIAAIRERHPSLQHVETQSIRKRLRRNLRPDNQLKGIDRSTGKPMDLYEYRKVFEVLQDRISFAQNADKQSSVHEDPHLGTLVTIPEFFERHPDMLIPGIVTTHTLREAAKIQLQAATRLTSTNQIRPVFYNEDKLMSLARAFSEQDAA